VTYLLYGSVRPLGDGYRVVARLIRGSDGLQRWSRMFEFGQSSADMENTALQIALHAYHYIDVDVQLAESRSLTSNDEAFGYYEQAFRLYQSLDTEKTLAFAQQVSDINDKAIELDPEFAPPYHLRYKTVGVGLDPAARVQAKRRAIDRYLELSPDDAIGYSDLGEHLLNQLDLAAADASLRRARSIEPDFFVPYVLSARVAMRRGRAVEAAALLRRALDLDGTQPVGHWYYALVLLELKDYDGADRHFDLVMRLNPRTPRLEGLGGQYLEALVARMNVSKARGRHDEFMARFEHAWAEFGATAPAAFADHLPSAGRSADLRKLMAEWDAGTRQTNPFERFRAHCALREHDDALAWLSRAVDTRQAYVTLRFHNFWTEIRHRPEYASILAQLNAQEISH
jgi:tetratricopeptide (TPR) repeat protein